MLQVLKFMCYFIFWRDVGYPLTRDSIYLEAMSPLSFCCKHFWILFWYLIEPQFLWHNNAKALSIISCLESNILTKWYFRKKKKGFRTVSFPVIQDPPSNFLQIKNFHLYSCYTFVICFSCSHYLTWKAPKVLIH